MLLAKALQDMQRRKRVNIDKSETCAVNLWSNAEKAQFHDIDWGITAFDMCTHQILFPKLNDFNIEFYKCCEDKVMPCFDVSLHYNKFPEFI